MVEPGPILKVDASYKASKVIIMDKTKVFDNVTCIMDQAHRIVTWKLCEDGHHDTLRPVVEGLKTRLDLYGFDDPNTLYSDQCCQDCGFYTGIFAALRPDRRCKCTYE